MNKNALGFTLIELLIVIAIIGILASIALPYYSLQMVRAKLVEVENAMAVVKGAVSTYRQERENIWPDCPTIDDIRNSLGVSLSALDRISAMDVSNTIPNGGITVTIQNIHPLVNNKQLTLTPILNPVDGSFSWIWGYSDDFPIHLRPKPR